MLSDYFGDCYKNIDGIILYTISYNLHKSTGSQFIVRYAYYYEPPGLYIIVLHNILIEQHVP